MAKTATNYHLFSLDNTMRSTVIALGIRKQRNHKSYRRSRGRRVIFHRISTIINQLENWCHLNKHCSKPSCIINWRNILPVQLDNTKVKSVSVSLTHCALINCRSVINKSADLQAKLVHNKVDICFLTETWIKEDDTTTETQICPLGYKAISVPRSNKQEGRIAIVYKDSITIWRSNTYEYSSMECTDVAVSLPGLSLNLTVIYRPLDKSVLSFANDSLDYMERNINSTGKLLLTGDYNIHVNDLESLDTNTFLDVLDSCVLHNHISFPTHHLNNTLDLVITSGQDNFIDSSNLGRLFSDHNIVYFNLTTSK